MQAHSLPVTGNTLQTAPENRAYYPALDGLRAIAFLMVFAQHYLYIPWGWTGVNVFFVLSGFLITGILFDTQDTSHRARNFYVRRTLRIFPLYYGIFALLVLLNPLMHWHWSLAWLAWPLYFGNILRFLSPRASLYGSSQELSADAHLSGARMSHTTLYLGHFWSLCVEEQFYLFWPGIVFWLRCRRRLLWICGTVVVAEPLLRILFTHTAPAWMLSGELLYRATSFQLDALLLGSLIALLWRGQHRRRLLLLGRVIALLCVLTAIIYLALTLHLSDPAWRDDYIYPAWKFTWGLTFVNIFSAATILTLLHPRGPAYHLLCSKPLRWVGRISYGAYVLHDILHDLYAHVVFVFTPRFPWLLTHRYSATAALALVGTLLLAYLSFRFFESPFLNLKEKWTLS